MPRSWQNSGGVIRTTMGTSCESRGSIAVGMCRIACCRAHSRVRRLQGWGSSSSSCTKTVVEPMPSSRCGGQRFGTAK